MSLSGANTFTATEAPFEPTGIFTFFLLSRELRDMIYDQPGLLENQRLPSFRGYSTQIVATKPRMNLRLVNRQFNAEYMERCEGRKGLLVRSFYHNLHRCKVEWSTEAAKQVNFLHLHVRRWGEPLSDFKDVVHWLNRHCSQMPRLSAISVKLYLALERPRPNRPVRRMPPPDLEAWLAPLIRIDALEVLKVIGVRRTSKTCHPFTLLLHWERKSNELPLLKDPPVEYAESCSESGDTDSLHSLRHE